jgi:hypothetical protein
MRYQVTKIRPVSNGYYLDISCLEKTHYRKGTGAQPGAQPGPFVSCREDVVKMGFPENFTQEDLEGAELDVQIGSGPDYKFVSIKRAGDLANFMNVKPTSLVVPFKLPSGLLVQDYPGCKICGGDINFKIPCTVVRNMRPEAEIKKEYKLFATMFCDRPACISKRLMATSVISSYVSPKYITRLPTLAELQLQVKKDLVLFTADLTSAAEWSKAYAVLLVSANMYDSKAIRSVTLDFVSKHYDDEIEYCFGPLFIWMDVQPTALRLSHLAAFMRARANAAKRTCLFIPNYYQSNYCCDLITDLIKENLMQVI